jgi:uncharacterized protein
VTIESPATELPAFRYHPDPLGTGSVIASAQSCDVCGKARGYVYDGPVHAEDDQWVFCPWCIADGSAAASRHATFLDDPGWGDGLPGAIVAEVRTRTPGFTAWQPERWLSCHGDAAAFLGACGIAELRKHGDPAVAAARRDGVAAGVPGAEVEAYLESLDAGGSPTAYLFRCLHCDGYLAYSDRDG